MPDFMLYGKLNTSFGMILANFVSFVYLFLFQGRMVHLLLEVS